MTRRQVNRLSAAVLAAGLLTALVVYLTAPRTEVDPLLGDPLTNRKYLRELRVMGGTANVVATEFREWFAGLWQGPALGGTLAVLTVGGVLVFRFFALLPETPADHGEPQPPPSETP